MNGLYGTWAKRWDSGETVGWDAVWRRGQRCERLDSLTLLRLTRDTGEVPAGDGLVTQDGSPR